MWFKFTVDYLEKGSRADKVAGYIGQFGGDQAIYRIKGANNWLYSMGVKAASKLPVHNYDLEGSDGNLSAAAPVAAQNAAEIVMRVNANTHIQTGETVHAAIAAGGLHVFSSGDGERLN